MPHLPDGYTTRLLTVEDAALVAELYNVRAVADGGQQDMTAERVSIEWQRENFELQTEAWLVLDPDGTAAGYEEVMQEATDAPMRLDGCVHPDHVGRGIGTYLVRQAEVRAMRKAGIGKLKAGVLAEITVAGGDDCAHRLMKKCGYEPVRTYSRMQIEMNAPPPSPDWPSGITVRPFVVGQDEYTMYEMMTDTFADVWGYVTPTFEQWTQGRFEGDEFDPSLWFFAIYPYGTERDGLTDESGEFVGAIMGIPRPDGGWVRGLGVLREYRGKGVGLALLRHVFGEFYRRGLRIVGLGVDAQSLTGAHRLYERAGMQVAERFVMYRKWLKG
jgi:mycothiol synthase